jgi:hypothetical protein
VACGKRGGSSLRRAREGLGLVVVAEGRYAVQFRTTAPSVHTLSEISANGFVLRDTSSSKSSPKVQFGQEICPKCATLDKILVYIQTLDLGKGRLENVFSFPNLKFSLDEKNMAPVKMLLRSAMSSVSPKFRRPPRFSGAILSSITIDMARRCLGAGVAVCACVCRMQGEIRCCEQSISRKPTRMECR